MPVCRHPEAFCLMEYHCQACGNIEIVWNSRDGVTPFIIDCPKCDGEAQHDNWNKDKRSPFHNLQPGQRYFVDCSKEEFIEAKRQMVEEYWEGKDGAPPMKEMFESKAQAVEELSKDFEPGQPTIKVQESPKPNYIQNTPVTFGKFSLDVQLVNTDGDFQIMINGKMFLYYDAAQDRWGYPDCEELEPLAEIMKHYKPEYVGDEYWADFLRKRGYTVTKGGG